MRTYRIELETFDPVLYPDGWVDIKDARSWADSTRIDSASLQMTPASNGAEMQVRADLLARGLKVLETAVIAWSLTDDAGAPVPATPSGFQSDALDADLGEWLLDQIEAHYAAQRRTQEARKNSAAPSTPL